MRDRTGGGVLWVILVLATIGLMYYGLQQLKWASRHRSAPSRRTFNRARRQELRPARVSSLAERIALEAVYTGARPAAQAAMATSIARYRLQVDTSNDPAVWFWFAKLILFYISLYVRGEPRQAHYSEAVRCLERAWSLADATLPDSISGDRGFRIGGFDIAGELGCILVEEALVRDVDKAIRYLHPIYAGTRRFEPSLCFYAEALYKKGELMKAVEVGLAIHGRAKREVKVADRVPTMPMAVVAKSLRSLARDAIRGNEPEKAVGHLERLVGLGAASASDCKRLEKLRSVGR